MSDPRRGERSVGRGRPGVARRPADHRGSVILIRPAAFADAETITELRLSLLAEEEQSPLFARRRTDVAQRARRLSELQLAGRTETILLAMAGERAVGMLRCVVARGSSLVRGSRHAMLTSAFVDPAFRRRGVLRRLVGAADDWCRSRRLREMRLHCTVENSGGNAAWLALGFSPAEILHRRVVPDA